MHIHILTIFPDMFTGPFATSIVGRAQEQGLVEITVCDIREFTQDRHHTTDDYPFGGGPGMVMKPEPLIHAVERLQGEREDASRVVLTTPQGQPFRQRTAARLSREDGLVMICGRYEGVDQRVRDLVVDEEISLGDYVLTGGELAAMVITDAVVRLLPGAVGDPDSLSDDSFAHGLLEGPHYTRPQSFRGHHVPEILLSGDHAAIDHWRRRASLRRTLLRRPELLASAPLAAGDLSILRELVHELHSDVALDAVQQCHLARALARAAAVVRASSPG